MSITCILVDQSMRSDVIEIDEIVLVDEVLANSVLRDVEDDLPS